MHSVLGPDLSVPPLQPSFHPFEMAFDTWRAYVFPNPSCQKAQRTVDEIANTERIERLDELVIHSGYHLSKLLFR